MGRILLYCGTVFLSAFLLFQVQPVIGKFILPWFGSTPGVWTTCMLFFQVLLLGGYAYAHLLVSRLTPKRQALLHGALLLLALLALPITPSEALKPAGGDAPVGGILLVLALSVGVPYLLLSSTGPLLQGWFARLHPGRSPYRLYALSNVGSLLALVTYPLYVEREWTLREQTFLWSLGFGLFVGVTGACAWTLYKGAVAKPVGGEPPAGSGAALKAIPQAPPAAASLWREVPLWFLLSAAGSALLLATTNQMCLDIAVVPFLWVAPLAIYLLSFILTFDHARWYARPVFLTLLPLSLWCAYSLLNEGVKADIAEQILAYGIALFVACMCCHGELARSKPAPQQLTFFFLVISFGGACGGLLVALVAPNVFTDFFEYPILLAAVYAVVLAAVFRNAGRALWAQHNPAPDPAWRVGLGIAGTCLTLLAVMYAANGMLDYERWLSSNPSEALRASIKDWFDSTRGWLWVPAAALLVLVELRRHLARRSFASWWGSARLNALVAAAIVGCLGLVAMVGACGWIMRRPLSRVIVQDRNFYGSLAIKEYSLDSRWHDWTLRHGRIVHGFQYRQFANWPTSYYGPQTGVGLAVRKHPERGTQGRSFRIGVVGLGTGTLAAYANARINPNAHSNSRYAETRRRLPGDVVRYYEINPMVVDWAWEHFTYLSDARKRGADVDVYLGDARLVMQSQLEAGEGQRFDVLAIDAFSSDAIPIHLLTKESFDVYWGHLAEGGALAIHVTNRFIELKPVVVSLAKAMGKSLIYVENYKDDLHGVDSSDWLVMTENTELLKDLEKVKEPLPDKPGPLWTDDYSSVWDLVKFEADKEVAEGKPPPDALWRRMLMHVGLATTTQKPEDDEDDE